MKGRMLMYKVKHSRRKSVVVVHYLSSGAYFSPPLPHATAQSLFDAINGADYSPVPDDAPWGSRVAESETAA